MLVYGRYRSGSLLVLNPQELPSRQLNMLGLASGALLLLLEELVNSILQQATTNLYQGMHKLVQAQIFPHHIPWHLTSWCPPPCQSAGCDHAGRSPAETLQ